ncbi:MAG TPA: T9SS type A sorting domain-containing protein [Lentimicrobium sp.]|nr:T9SS type A sorting domain-containing protein [Lentimicrobium sp.]
MKTILITITLSLLFNLSGYSQISWEKYPGNPVMVPGDPGSFNSGGYAFVTVIMNNDTLDMWYTVSDQQEQRIGLARSVNGYEFEFCDSVPLFEPSVGGGFDTYGVFNPQILKINDTSWYMWYSGLNNTNFNSQVGLAVSSDGLNWERYSTDPVLPWGPAGSWDNLLVYAGTVLFDEGIYKMWYTGMNTSYTYRIGYATSPDGIVWTRYQGNPILTFPAANPKVMKTLTGYQMWYNESVGGKMYIFYALSDDGIIWQGMDAPVLSPDPGTFDDEGVTAPSVVFNETTGLYQMWYTAWSAVGNYYSVGYATDSSLVSIDSPETINTSLSIYPIPAKNRTVITFNLNKTSHTTLSVISLSGIEMLCPLDEIRTPGTYKVELDCSEWPAGIYLCRLIAGNTIVTRKFIIVK